MQYIKIKELKKISYRWSFSRTLNYGFFWFNLWRTHNNTWNIAPKGGREPSYVGFFLENLARIYARKSNFEENRRKLRTITPTVMIRFKPCNWHLSVSRTETFIHWWGQQIYGKWYIIIILWSYYKKNNGQFLQA